MPARKQAQARAPEAGSLAVPLHGGYAVRPGTAENGPEHFDPTPEGAGAAAGRAVWLSFSGPDQQVLVLQGREARAVFAYSGGVCTLRPDGVIPAGGPAAVPS